MTNYYDEPTIDRLLAHLKERDERIRELESALVDAQSENAVLREAAAEAWSAHGEAQKGIRELEQENTQSAIAMNEENDRHILRIVQLEDERDIAEGAIRMAVDRLEGTVEDKPTHEGNFLRRIDELRKLEQQLKTTLERLAEASATLSTGQTTGH